MQVDGQYLLKPDASLKHMVWVTSSTQPLSSFERTCHEDEDVPGRVTQVDGHGLQHADMGTLDNATADNTSHGAPCSYQTRAGYRMMQTLASIDTE
jgi:hypothetical protein